MRAAIRHVDGKKAAAAGCLRSMFVATAARPTHNTHQSAQSKRPSPPHMTSKSKHDFSLPRILHSQPIPSRHQITRNRFLLSFCGSNSVVLFLRWNFSPSGFGDFFLVPRLRKGNERTTAGGDSIGFQ